MVICQNASVGRPDMGSISQVAQVKDMGHILPHQLIHQASVHQLVIWVLQVFAAHVGSQAQCNIIL